MMATIDRGLRFAAIVLTLALPTLSARAADCDGLLSSKAPVLMRGSSVTIWKGTVKPGLASFRITRGEDPVRVTEAIGSESEPSLELLIKGILITRTTNLKSKQAIDYDYPSIQGVLTTGTEMRYTRLVKQGGELASTETGIAHIGETSLTQVGDCEVEVMAIDSEVQSDKAPARAARLLYAPQLGYFVKAESAGSLAGSDFATAFSATSLELAP